MNSDFNCTGVGPSCLAKKYTLQNTKAQSENLFNPETFAPGALQFDSCRKKSLLHKKGHNLSKQFNNTTNLPLKSLLTQFDSDSIESKIS